MKEIRDAFYNLLEADAGIQSMTGHTVSDTRIYEDSPPKDIAMDVTFPAYMTYKWMAPGGITPDSYVQKAQYSDEVCERNVYAKTSALRDQLAERIGLILKDKTWNTTSYRVLTTDQEGAEDIQEIHPGTAQLIIKRKYMRFRLRNLYRK